MIPALVKPGETFETGDVIVTVDLEVPVERLMTGDVVIIDAWEV